MANNEDVNQSNDGAPAADIPDLKKKEKERKKAGAGWGGVKPGGGSFSGATGGTVARAAASAASSAGGAAAIGAAEAAGAGWLSSMIATLTATVLGKALLAAGVAAFLMGAGLFGYAMLKGGAGGAAGAGGVGDLGAISSSMKVRGDGADRTGFIASNGEIMFDPLKKAAEAKKAEAEKAPEDKTAGEAVPPADKSGDGALAEKGGWNRPGLEHNMSGSKLSSGLGGGFGGKNIFGGNSSAPKLNEALGKVNIQGAQKGRLTAAKNARTGRTVTGGKGRQAKSSRAFGQLIASKGNSALGAGASGVEGARSGAASAFDGAPSAGTIAGGPATPGGGTDTGGTVGSPSSPGGAPDVTIPDVDDPCVAHPEACGYTDHTNFDAIKGISALAIKAGEMKKKAAKLMMMGIALIIAGIAAFAIPVYGSIIGAILIGIGGMLIGMSMMMSNMAEMMKGMADSMSEGLAARTSDVKQDEINKFCIDKAYNEGTDPAKCNPPDGGPLTDANNHSDDADVSEQNKEHADRIRENSRVEGGGGPTP